MSDLYELAPTPKAPRLTGTVVMREGPDDVIDAAAADLLLHAHNCVRSFGDFHLALSGGSTPLPLYRRLMVDPAYREFPWGRTHLWIVDERRVPFDDERSNFKAISELIAEHSGIPQSQVHPMFAMSDDADAEYERLLQETLGWRDKGQDRLDYVLLGMGSDGHTASLFPRSPALVELPPVAREENASGRTRLVRINAGPTVTPPERVTMTLPLINASRFIALLVTGAAKHAAVTRVAAAAGAERTGVPAHDAVESLPVLGVRPLAGELRWYLDHAACAGEGR